MNSYITTAVPVAFEVHIVAKAREMGISKAAYVRHLIAEDVKNNQPKEHK